MTPCSLFSPICLVCLVFCLLLCFLYVRWILYLVFSFPCLFHFGTRSEIKTLGEVESFVLFYVGQGSCDLAFVLCLCVFVFVLLLRWFVGCVGLVGFVGCWFGCLMDWGIFCFRRGGYCIFLYFN